MGRRLGWLRWMAVAVVLLAALAPVGAFAAKRGSQPAITGVDPPSGPLGGGTSVTITGVAFTKTSEVDFGGVSAGFSQTQDTVIIAVSPPGSAGIVDITVTTQDGTSSITPADEFTYQNAPVVKRLNPISGPIGGGTVVTITGSNFTGATKVEFGFAVSDNFKVKSPTSIQAVTPAGTGPQDVTVTTPSGQNNKGPQFTFEDAPLVDSISPPSGPPAGGTHVTIVGQNFVGALEVDFGKVTFQPKDFTVTHGKNADAIDLRSPKGAVGNVNVRVVTTSGTSDPPGTFTYQDAPKVTSVVPRSGSTKGGTKVLVKGQNFVGALAVTFGGKAGSGIDVNSGTELTVITPAGSGTVDVQVTTTSGTSAKVTADHFTFQGVPVVKSVTPSSGPLLGGTKVTIKGTGFLEAVGVKFGNNAATDVKVVSSTEITAVSPVGVGTVHVIVATAVGISAKTTADEFTYSSHSTPSGGVQTGAGGTAGGGFPWVPVTVILLSLAGFAALRFWYRRA